MLNHCVLWNGRLSVGEENVLLWNAFEINSAKENKRFSCDPSYYKQHASFFSFSFSFLHLLKKPNQHKPVIFMSQTQHKLLTHFYDSFVLRFISFPFVCCGAVFTCRAASCRRSRLVLVVVLCPVRNTHLLVVRRWRTVNVGYGFVFFPEECRAWSLEIWRHSVKASWRTGSRSRGWRLARKPCWKCLR